MRLIDRIEDLLDQGWRLPLSRRVAIDEDAFLNIVDQMRITIPQEIKQAQEVQLEKDEYIAKAHEEARRIIAQAREDAAKQLDEHELKAAAQAQAEGIIEQAHKDIARIRAGADEYAEARLKELGRSVGQLQRVIQNGLTALETRRAELKEEVPQTGQYGGAEGNSSSEPPLPFDEAGETKE